MLKAFKLPVNLFDSSWVICPFTGSLVKAKENVLTGEVSHLPEKIERSLFYCNEPFKLQPISKNSDELLTESQISSLNKIHNRLLYLGNSRFLMSVLYAGYQKHIFDDSIQAMSALSLLPEHITQSRCLQKTLFTAKTSRSFKDNGVLFIGAQLPTGDMHAWIIENDMQPDFVDRSWVNFRPLVAYICN